MFPAFPEPITRDCVSCFVLSASLSGSCSHSPYDPLRLHSQITCCVTILPSTCKKTFVNRQDDLKSILMMFMKVTAVIVVFILALSSVI
jgi:hypothetical protein